MENRPGPGPSLTPFCVNQRNVLHPLITVLRSHHYDARYYGQERFIDWTESTDSSPAYIRCEWILTNAPNGVLTYAYTELDRAADENLIGLTTDRLSAMPTAQMGKGE